MLLFSTFLAMPTTDPMTIFILFWNFLWRHDTLVAVVDKSDFQLIAATLPFPITTLPILNFPYVLHRS